MNKFKMNFLYEKLDELQQVNIITEEQNIKSKEYFSESEQKIKTTSTIFTAIGVLLIGLSIITLFAVNWENLNINIKTMVAFIPILITSLMTYITFRNNSNRWKLYTSIFAPISIYSSLSLIVNTYRANIDSLEVLFLSIVMFIPFVFLLKNNTSILIYGVSTVIYSLSKLENYNVEEHIIYVFAIFFPIFMYNIYLLIKDGKNNINIFMFAVNALITTAILGRYELITTPDYLFLIYILAMFAFRNNKVVTSILNILAVILILMPTIDTGIYYSMTYKLSIPSIVFTTASIIGFVYLKMYKNIRDLIFIAFLILIQYSGLDKHIMLIINNIIAAVLGIYYIVMGSKEFSFAKTDGGIAIILTLILFKFLNSDLDFTQKSIMFAFSGLIFIVTSIFMQKRLRSKNV